jgi:septum site-determining protein MinC
MPPKVQIKGIREGLLITLGEGEWAEAREALFNHLDQQGEFLAGARLSLEVGNHIIKAADMGKLRDDLSSRGLSLRAVISDSPTTERTAQALGLATRLSKPHPSRVTRPLDTALQGEQAVLVRRTLRSGNSIKYHGHVVVIGDVNPGAEIVASGNVVVWGRLRGMVHAGADGNQNAVVCALDLSPTQLRIAECISITPTDKKQPQPEMAHLNNDQVIAEPWIMK